MVDTKESKVIENQAKYIALDLRCNFFDGQSKTIK